MWRPCMFDGQQLPCGPEVQRAQQLLHTWLCLAAGASRADKPSLGAQPCWATKSLCVWVFEPPNLLSVSFHQMHSTSSLHRVGVHRTLGAL